MPHRRHTRHGENGRDQPAPGRAPDGASPKSDWLACAPSVSPKRSCPSIETRKRHGRHASRRDAPGRQSSRSSQCLANFRPHHCFLRDGETPPSLRRSGRQELELHDRAPYAGRAGALSARSISITSSRRSSLRQEFRRQVTTWSAPPRFWSLLRAREAHEHATHQPRSHGKEMCRSCHLRRRMSTSRR